MKKIITSVLLFTSVLTNAQSFQLVKNVNQSPDNEAQYINSSFREMNGKLYYVFYDQTTGKNSLFVSDGTESGTNSISPSNVSVLGNLIIGGGKIYFFASDGVNGKEPWVSDGTTLGTQLLKNIHPTINDSDYETTTCEFLSADSAKAFFIANDSLTGPELWVTDGTPTGTTFVFDINAGANGSQIQVAPSGIGTNIKDGKLYFFALNGTGGFTINGIEPWVSDGTNSGTFMLKDIQTGFNGSSSLANTKHFIEYNDKMYFYAGGSAGQGLWETDGTALGTQLAYSTSISRIDEFILHNNLIYFTHSDGPTLYTTDGTSFGTTLLDTIPNAQLNNLATSQMVIANNTLFLRVISNTIGSELYKLDGINQIVLVKDINTANFTNGVNSNVYKDKKILQVHNNKVWFLGSDGSLNGAMQMWNSDGTNTGTIAISPLNNDGGFAGGNGNNYNIIATSFGMFMIYFNSITGAELYKYEISTGVVDNVGSKNLVNIYPTPSNDYIVVNSDLQIVSYKITNTLGQVIKSDNFDNQPINISDFKDGIYMLNVITADNKRVTQKILKQ